MSISNTQLFSCMQQLDQSVEYVEKTVEAIESQLQSPLSSADYYRLFVDLDRALKPMQQLKETARSLHACGKQFLERLQKLEERSPVLFGDLLTEAVDREVVEIQSEAEHLQSSLSDTPMLSIARKVDALKQHISTLRHDHALSQKNLTIIGAVEHFVETVERFLEISKDAPPHLDRVQGPHINSNLGLDPVTSELLMEIFEVAELYESGHGAAAKRKERLPAAIQQRLETLKLALESVLGVSSDHLYGAALFALSIELTQGKKLDNPLEAVISYYSGLESVESTAAKEYFSPALSYRSVGG